MSAPLYPHSGKCENCRRERDDLFWHREDQTFYCADVFRCEARLHIQAMRPDPRTSGGTLTTGERRSN